VTAAHTGTSRPRPTADGRRPAGPAAEARRALAVFAAGAAASTAALTQYNQLPAAAQAAVITFTAAVFLSVPAYLLNAVRRAFRNSPPDPPGPQPPAPARPSPARLLAGLAGRAITTALMLAAIYATAAGLPFEVNAAAYLAGAGHAAVFVPVTQNGTTCGRGGCNSSTAGYLLPGKTPATWPDTVPVGQPFPVRTLIWHTPNAELIGGIIYAIGRFLIWFLLVTGLDLVLIPLGIAKLLPRRRHPAHAAPGDGPR
jgi:hypothetical protein